MACDRCLVQRSSPASPPWKWDMDIEQWLRGLRLQQYVTAFRENNVDAEVLLCLTAEDLKDIGVSSVGHRRKLLEAIAALQARPAPPSATNEGIPPVAEAPQVEPSSSG